MYIEKGYIVPGPRAARRIRNWMVAGANYEGAKLPDEASWRLEMKRQGWRAMSILLPPAAVKELRKVSRRLSTPASTLAVMAIELFVANKVGHTTLEEARKHMQRMRMIDALQEAPELRDILQCEMPIAIAAGATLVPWAEVEKIPESQKLAEVEKHELFTIGEKEIEDV
jgi:hypothetical protein